MPLNLLSGTIDDLETMGSLGLSKLHMELTLSKLDLIMTAYKDAGHDLRCPSCNEATVLTSQTHYDVEHFGSVLMTVLTCSNCGYKHTDVMTLTERKPIAITANVDSLEDLNMRVIKSGTATVSIPEFGASITPGPYSEGYISNLEGILERVEDALTFMLTTAQGKRLKKGENMLRRIKLAKEAKERFRVVIKDPFGNSAIVSDDAAKVKTRRLTNRELANVKYGSYVIAAETPR